MSLVTSAARDWLPRPPSRRSAAVGPEALRIGRNEESSQPAASAWQLSRDAAWRDLREIIGETAKPGWDGGDARPLSRRALDALTDAFLTLTPHVPIPEIVPEPDGGVAMQWSGGRARSLIVSFGPDGSIYYAVHVPDHRESGRRCFDTSIPQDLLELAKEVAAGDP